MQDFLNYKALAKHNTLVASAKSAKALEQVYHQSLSDPTFYFFGQLLVNPMFDKLDKKVQNSANLFCYGSVQTYNANPSDFLSLTKAQYYKLQVVTMLRLANLQKILSYDQLAQKLGMKSDEEVEQIALTAMMAGLMKGRMNQRERMLKVHQVIGVEMGKEELSQFKKYVKLETEKLGELIGKVSSSLNQIAISKKQRAQLNSTIKQM